MASTNNCNEFRAHSLRPDKCRDCFGDRAQHSADNDASANETTNLLNSTSNNHASNKETEKSINKSGDRCALCEERQAKIEQLEDELKDWKQRCLDAESSCNEAHNELKALEHEMEEMKDSFREEESVQFEQLKKDFETEAKKSKILQFRLNKCERQCGQLEQINLALERQVEELRHQQQETNIRNKIDSTNHSQQTQQQQQQPQAFVQLGTDFVKISTTEYDQLLRDLNDTSERERDLQEQVRFAQEEAQCKGDRLQAVEAENEVLLGRVSKLTLANSRLKSNLLSGSKTVDQSSSSTSSKNSAADDADDLAKVLTPRDLYEQNEQFRLALEMAQAECSRLNTKLQANTKLIESKEATVRKLELQLRQHETTSSSSSSVSSTTATDQTSASSIVGQQSRLEFECRQLRARLVHSERECRQLKAQIELLISSGSSQARNAHLASSSRSQSLETSGGCCKCGAKCNDINKRLEDQCQLMQAQREELQRKVDQLTRERAGSSGVLPAGDSVSSLEADLLEKLKRQLDMSESELANARSRLVELDLKYSHAQRQYKDLLSSLEGYSADQQVIALQRMRSRAPSESQSELMSRTELRQAVRDLESNLDEVIAVVRVKNSLIDELKTRLEDYENDDRNQADQRTTVAPVEEQLKSVRRQLDQERLTTSNLKIDVANLEEQNEQMRAQVSVNERKCSAMTEELDQMRRVSGEIRAELEESRRQEQCALVRSRDYELVINDLRKELAEARKQSAQAQTSLKSKITGNISPENNRSHQNDILLLSRDLSELKVKNGFLMRQLEIAREDTAKQLEELRSNAEAQQRQAIEVAQLELREKHLAELQNLRDEIGDLKQKLSGAQRQVAKQEEETSLEREKVRSIEREWRRDKSQWQQRYEQLEAQVAIERRTSEFRSKEAESISREKERQLISVQDRCVQMERDLKRLQNKYSLLEENCDTRVKSLSRDLENKSRELAELSSLRQQVDERHFVECRRLQTEKSTLAETLDSLRRSYEERSAELKSVRDLLIVRQEQAYRERANAQERIESLSDKLDEMSEHETQCKLLRQRLEALERHLESARDERSRLKTRCDELERKCVQYEKRELIGKTTSIISGTSSSFLRFGGSSATKNRLSAGSAQQSSSTSAKQTDGNNNNNNNNSGSETSVVERLSGKINDQRHLINMLRQQLNETQLELKQLKLLQSSEKSKWQTKCTLLTSRLNECEERMAFETALLIGERSPAVSATSTGLMDKVVRPKLEQQWSKERHSTMELMQQQQSQIEMLARDLKKISQAHDLLRLHSKQLESHNNKLSKKLIEYQQHYEQKQLVPSARLDSNRAATKQVSELEARNEQLRRANDRLREHARPLVKIMSKVVSSLDSPANTSETATDPRSSSPGEASSMSRPLRAGDPMTMAAIAQATKVADELEPGDTTTKTTMESSSASAPQRSRLARLLGGGGSQQKSVAAKNESQKDDANSSGSKKSSVRKVRIKSSTLGITPTEKRQLKEHLRELSAAMDLTSTLTSSDNNATSSSASQQIHSKAEAQSQSSSKSSPTPAIKPTAADLYLRHVAATPTTGGSASQTRPIVSGSLTDYEESESSLASYGFAPPSSGLTIAAGAESDSGLATAPGSSSLANKLGDRKRRGLKNRLTNTLRNLSRSITAGLGSDSETEGSVASQNEHWYDKSNRRVTLAKRPKNPNLRQASVESELSVQSELGTSTRSGSVNRDVSTRASSALREIRV